MATNYDQIFNTNYNVKKLTWTESLIFLIILFRIKYGPNLDNSSPCQRAAFADQAAYEQQKDHSGGDGGDQDVHPSLRLQLGAATIKATEEEHIFVPFCSGGFISRKKGKFSEQLLILKNILI